PRPPASPLFPYTTLFRSSCPPPCIQANGTFYDWFPFAGDLLFFIAITYLIVLYSLRKRQALRTVLESRKLLGLLALLVIALAAGDRKSTRLNSSHVSISY